MPSKRIMATCETCSAPFSYWPSQHKGGPARFCSRPCWWKFLNQGGENRICEQCGKTFTRPARKSDRMHARRFCGNACHLKFKRKDGLSWEERFWLEVNKTADCWLWTGGTRRGYGEFTRTWAEEGESWDRRSSTHLAWEIATGESVPSGMMIGHACDTPLCVRNDEAGVYQIGDKTLRRHGHLFLCTISDNAADMSNKGRHAAAVLTPDQVRAIRRRHASGEAGPSPLAREFGVTRSAVKSILSRKTWKHLRD